MSEPIPTVTVDAQGYPIHIEECRECCGDGYVLGERDPGDPYTRILRETCERCRGDGQIEVEGCDCSLCAQVMEDLERRPEAALLPYVPAGVLR